MDHQQPENDPENSSDLLLSLSQPRTQTPHMLVHYETTGRDANDEVLTVTMKPNGTSAFLTRQELVFAGLSAIMKQLDKIWNT